MNRILAGKKVVFFDVGYTIDYPASGDWMFTRKFNEVACERIQNCSEEQIRQARNVGMAYLERNHFIRDEKEDRISGLLLKRKKAEASGLFFFEGL